MKLGLKLPHPGEHVLENCLKPLELNVTDGAKALGVGRVTLSRLIHGRSSLSPDMAVRLEMAFGSTAEHWLRLQGAYDLQIAEKNRKHLKIKRVKPSKAA